MDCIRQRFVKRLNVAAFKGLELPELHETLKVAGGQIEVVVHDFGFRSLMMLVLAATDRSRRTAVPGCSAVREVRNPIAAVGAGQVSSAQAEAALVATASGGACGLVV
ncbi:hypothetical protein [Blastochloris tepida]|uniref:hypothetical protein n=1 Tax=Blastochloris tepida TaxID=2233851 RepID=UPI000F822B88|nr:hypothetical protein [Blastochloris tepida]